MLSPRDLRRLRFSLLFSSSLLADGSCATQSLWCLASVVWYEVKLRHKSPFHLMEQCLCWGARPPHGSEAGRCPQPSGACWGARPPHVREAEGLVLCRQCAVFGSLGVLTAQTPLGSLLQTWQLNSNLKPLKSPFHYEFKNLYEKVLHESSPPCIQTDCPVLLARVGIVILITVNNAWIFSGDWGTTQRYVCWVWHS